MGRLVTVATFSHPAETAVIKSVLEGNGIECFMKDGITVQVDPLLSPAVGGVKLQVREEDVNDALLLLREGGYVPHEEPVTAGILDKFDAVTSAFPLIGHRSLLSRLMIVLAAVITVLTIVLAIFLGPA